MLRYLLPLLALLINGCSAQTNFNGDFEKLDPENRNPQGWSLAFSPTQAKDFNTKLDSLVKQSGKYSVSIERFGKDGQYGAIDYTIPKSFEGKTIELRGYLKTQDVKTACGLWLRLDGAAGANLGFDNMLQQGIKGTSDWKQYSIKMPYTSEVKAIHFGGLLQGDGKVWFDNFELFIDGKSIAGAVPAISYKAELDTSFSKSSGINAIALTDQQINNLFIAGQYWGFLKYHHSNINDGNYNWDAELLRLLPAVISAKDNIALSKNLEVFLDKFKAPDICKTCAFNNENLKIKPDYGDLFTGKVLSSSLTNKLKFIFENRSQGNNYWVGIATYGNPEFKHENAYTSMRYPDAGYRLLSLYRYWSMINYFFPNKDVIDGDWNKVLKEFVPIFFKAQNEEEYTLSTLRLIARIQDTHANIWGINKALENFKGKFAAPFEAKFIEEKLIVTDFYTDSSGLKQNLKVGDEIKYINGTKVTDLVKKYLPITPASNYDTQLRDLPNNYLLRSNEKKMKLVVGKGNSLIETYLIDYKSAYKNTDDLNSTGYKILNENIGYVYPGKYRNDDMPDIIKQFKNTKGIIVDMRCYPLNFMPFTFGNFIKSDFTPFVKFTFFNPGNPGAFTVGTMVKNGGGYDSSIYKGNVVVIVNATSQSQAEYTTLAFQSAPNVKVIGSQTAGADGNVSSIVLPGGISTMISGIGIFYPDGTPTQKVGVKIDYRIKPTINGVKAGKDELLDYAIAILNKGW
ncbi:S41 family peptidase [Pedobacter aquatilis]|uniref:S41 family peptidase n=1 Tax=Pedobacter aquatilis TaxID=351343 RepID=UPI00292FE493|nr:S41 family peptidase [Pedobacter aquatilis]